MVMAGQKTNATRDKEFPRGFYYDKGGRNELFYKRFRFTALFYHTFARLSIARRKNIDLSKKL